MNPLVILEAIKAVAEAITETLRYLQTPQGQRFADQVMADRGAWDKFWKDAGAGISDLFRGKLWEAK